MRIAFFHNLPSGGGKRSAHEWLKRMSQNHEVDLYLYDPAAEDFLDLRPFVRRTVLVPGGETGKALSPGPGIFAVFNRLRRVSKEVARRINTGGYDLAFVMQCKRTNTPFVLRYLRLPSLYFCHEPFAKILEPHFRTQKGLLEVLKLTILKGMAQIDQANARHASLICANSRYSLETIYRAYGVYPRLNYVGVDSDQFRPLKVEKEKVVLSVGTLCPLKAQDFIIESVGTMTDRPAVRCIYNFGIMNYHEQLTRLAARLHVSVSFDRLLSHDDLVMAYNRAVITAFPSRLEPFGLVPLESLACRTPVVGVAEAGIRETMQHGETGFLTERDPEDFGRALETLLKDESLRIKMGENGRRQVMQHWSWDQSYQKLEENLHRAISSISNCGK